MSDTQTDSPPTLSYEDVKKILADWEANGPSPGELAAFQEAAIHDLKDPEKVREYEANVEQVGIWASEVDASFGNVTRGLQQMVDRYGNAFPELVGFRNEWGGYNQRWVSLLNLSRNVASEHITILRRYDQVFLHMVEDIHTDGDRQEVIKELQSFIDESHPRADEMAQGFYSLRLHIQNFIQRFDTYAQAQGAEFQAQAIELRRQIAAIQSSIESLNWEIAGAIIALVASAIGATTIIGLLGLVASSVILALLIFRRVRAEIDLRDSQRELARVNAQQQALAWIATQFDGLRPDILLICDRLKLFGDLWQNIRSDCIRVQAQLRGGMSVVNDQTFKREIRLARAMCSPMQGGLERYATQLSPRPVPEVEGASMSQAIVQDTLLRESGEKGAATQDILLRDTGATILS